MVTNLAPRRIGLIGYPGVTGLHLTGPVDIFTAAALDDGYSGRIPCYDVCVVGLNSSPFQTESGLVLRSQKTLRSAPAFDTIIVPGGRGLGNPAVCDAIASWLKRQGKETRRIAALANGVYALAASGLLAGREVTTHWRCARDLARCFPTLRVDHRKPMVWDGPFGTSSGGLTAGLEVSRYLVTEDFGPHMFRSLERDLLLVSAPENHCVGRTEPAYFVDQANERFAELVAWMLRNLDDDLTVPALARRACMCRDGFSRAFKGVFGIPPAKFVENLRLNEARRRLSTSRRMVQSVARSVGFRDPVTFGRAFERRFGVRPATLPSAEGDKLRFHVAPSC